MVTFNNTEIMLGSDYGHEERRAYQINDLTMRNALVSVQFYNFQFIRDML